MKMAKNEKFLEIFHFYSNLDYYKIRTRTNFENNNSKSLNLPKLIMWFALTLFRPGFFYRLKVQGGL